jgi:hypothetical protein
MKDASRPVPIGAQEEGKTMNKNAPQLGCAYGNIKQPNQNRTCTSVGNEESDEF